MAKQEMSLEQMLDEERKDVLALLEGPPSKTRHRGSTGSMGSARASSPFTRQAQSPIRSMLDVDEGSESPRKTSLTGTNGTGVAIPPRKSSSQTIRSMLDMSPSPHSSPAPVRSMLDIGEGSASKRRTSSSASTQSAASSPTDERSTHKAQLANSLPHRSLSDAARKPASFGPRAASTGGNPESAYQFGGYAPSNPGGPVPPKRNTLAGRKTSAMAEVVRGGTISLFGDKDRDRGRNNSVATTGISTKSRSPAPRSILRSNSPSVKTESSKLVLNDGRVVDMNSAYRRLSDANLALSGGGLSSLGGKKQRSRTNSDNVPFENGARLEKDYVDSEDVIMDSSDDDDSISDDDQLRGRKHEKRQDRANSDSAVGVGRPKGARQAQSLMAAAEEERDQIAAAEHEKYKIRSLLDPEITVTAPGGDRYLRHEKATVHPNTSFDEGTSGLNTPVDSDTEQDVTDIKHAQKLSVNMTPIQSTPATSRCVRTIYRGDFSKMQQEAKDHQRRVRKYLVATDLSDEAAHALEWTVGTVLRDGDTLLAIYCVDEDVGIANNDSEDDTRMKEQIAAIQASTNRSGSTPLMSPTTNFPSPLGPGFRLDSHSASASPMGRERGKAEHERYRAVQDITDRVSRLLRKTKLQVKVVIEVIHCKSPKHLITEVIDFISPTMVILGSRGQSQLKGVILGSFSNYLVTKSSVPVMVARKRLRKHTKYKRPAIRLANNLSNPAVKSLATAKID